VRNCRWTRGIETSRADSGVIRRAPRGSDEDVRGLIESARSSNPGGALGEQRVKDYECDSGYDNESRHSPCRNIRVGVVGDGQREVLDGGGSSGKGW